MGKSIEKLKMSLKKRFTEVRPLIKFLSLPLIICLISFAVITKRSTFVDSSFLVFLTVFTFSLSSLILLLLLDLILFFSISVFSGTPKKPSVDSILLEFLLFFGLILLLLIIFGIPEELKGIGRDLLLVIIAIIIIWARSWMKSYKIKYSTAGRFFTYASSSTAWYLAIVFLCLPGLASSLGSSISSNTKGGKLLLGLSINDLEIVLSIIFFLVLAIIFFLIKESIFEHYGNKLVSLESKSLKKEKEKRVNLICKKLDDDVSGDGTRIDLLSKEVELLEKRVAYIDKEIKKIEKKFEFHGSLKLNIAVSPIGFLILEVVKDFPPLDKILGLLFGL